MMAFLLQALLWLVAAFLLGFAISRFLKSLFCRDNPTQEIYSGGMTAPPVDTAIPRTSVAAKTATVLGGAAAAGAVPAARHKTTTDLPDVDVAVKAPAVPTLDFNNIDPHKPIIDPPDIDWISNIDPHKPIIDPPDLQADMPDTLDMTGDWLHDLVTRTRAAYHGKHLRMVSRLWDANAGYDCSSLGEEYEALDLTASQYDRMGVFHCGVTRDGFVSVGGDVATLAVGEAVLFHYPNIVVCRHADEEYRFIRIAV